MNNEETKVLNPVNQDKNAGADVKSNAAEGKQQVEQSDKKKKVSGIGAKAAYGVGGFAAGVAAGAAVSGHAATTPDRQELPPDVIENAETDANSDESTDAVVAENQTNESNAGEQEHVASSPADVHVTVNVAQPAVETTSEESAPSAYDVQDAPSPGEAILATSEGVRVAQVPDDVSFGEAFADARAQVGPGGVFEWHGHVYGTYYENEWNQMSSEEKAAYQSKIDYSAVTDGTENGDYETSSHVDEMSHDTITQTVVEDASESETASSQMEGHPENSEVSIIGMGVVDDGNGHEATAAALEMDGHHAILLDVDMDGTFDVAAVDANDNGVLDEGEYGDISDMGITTQDIAEQLPDSDSYLADADGMPDYMNDADVSTLA